MNRKSDGEAQSAEPFNASRQPSGDGKQQRLTGLRNPSAPAAPAAGRLLIGNLDARARQTGEPGDRSRLIAKRADQIGIGRRRLLDDLDGPFAYSRRKLRIESRAIDGAQVGQ
jgi:hypothetical protein